MDQEQEPLQPASPPPQETMPSADLPEEAFREAERYQLGLPLQRYQDRDPRGLKTFWKIWGVLTGIVLLLVLIFLIIDYSIAVIIVEFFVFGLGSIPLIALIETVREVLQLRKRGYLCENGFLIMTGRSHVYAAIQWDEIVEIFEERDEKEVERKWWVITRDQKRVTISILTSGKVREMEQLGQKVLEEFQRLHPPDLRTMMVAMVPVLMGLTHKRKYVI